MDVPDDDEDEPTYDAPEFKALKSSAAQEKKQVRRVAVPAHRMTPLKSCWVELIEPLVQHLKLQVRMNTKRRSFEVKDVKRLNGDHLSRAIGRLAGKDGKTKYAIENATRTRIVLADEKIHILGSFGNMKVARNAVCSLILGSPPSKVYSHLRTVSKRIMEHV